MYHPFGTERWSGVIVLVRSTRLRKKGGPSRKKSLIISLLAGNFSNSTILGVLAFLGGEKDRLLQHCRHLIFAALRAASTKMPLHPSRGPTVRRPSYFPNMQSQLLLVNAGI
jgi:hypothetical protein